MPFDNFHNCNKFKIITWQIKVGKGHDRIIMNVGQLDLSHQYFLG